MAWDNGSFCGYGIVSGDKPIDELSIALRKISAEYVERFDRKPTVAEFLYAFKIVTLGNGNEAVSDPENLDKILIELKGKLNGS